MPLKLTDDEHGLTYTLEAILGVVLILSTVLFFTNSLPYVAQKTGEHSKVQLMNIGRDNLDLIEVTPVTDINPKYWDGQVYRNYTLVADKKFVRPGENVTFTVYTLGYGEIVYHNLTLRRSVLGLDTETDIGIINGTMVTNFSSVGDYNVRALELVGKDDVLTWSNYVTIKVGYYFLDTDISGISDVGDKNVSGVVYNSTSSGIPGLSIEILDSNKEVVSESIPPITNTSYGRVIDDCEYPDLWTSSDTLSSNNNNISGNNSGNNSISVNGTGNSSIWIQKTSTSYEFDYYDILSFYLFSINGNETIKLELSNSSDSVTGKLTWINTNSLNLGWNKINFILKYPDNAEGNVTRENADTIKIKVSNITNNEDYLFDYMIAGEGRFSFIWPSELSGNGDKGSYYIQARDSNDNTSNRHRIIFSAFGLITSEKYVVYEGEQTRITLAPGGDLTNLDPIHKFNINQIFYKSYDKKKVLLTPFGSETKFVEVDFVANTSGDYYIFYGNTGMGGGGDPAAGTFTNTILIHVLPIDGRDVLFKNSSCGGINITQLNEYMRLNMPPYVNYNLYLINPDGTLCHDCPEFTEIINGYPTGEAVTVNKVIHLNQRRDLGFIRELRMVLWYK